MKDPGSRWRIQVTIVANRTDADDCLSGETVIERDKLVEVLHALWALGVNIDYGGHDYEGEMLREMSRERLQHEQALLLLQEGVTWAETKRRVG